MAVRKREIRADIGGNRNGERRTGLSECGVIPCTGFSSHICTVRSGDVIGQRLRAAQSLLQNSSYPIKEIAARIGYSSQLYFATEFKRLTGETPGDYRRRQKFSRTFEFNRARRNGGASPSAETDGEKTDSPL